MMRGAARPIDPRSPMPRGAAIAAVLLSVLAAAASPAAANCGSTPQTFYRPTGSYVCYMECAVAGREVVEIRRLNFAGGREAVLSLGTCTAECTATPGCTSYTWHDFYDKGIQYVVCILYAASSEATTVDRPDVEKDGRSWITCHRQPSEFRDPGERIDRDQFRPDVFRPGIPSTPSGPGKK